MTNSVMPPVGGANRGLIPLTHTDSGVQAVMGRDLHAFLEVTTPYRIWFPRMVEYGFTAGQDFMNKNVQNPNGGRPRQDHIISLDMAKEISMIQRSEKGRQARQYFIECERRYRAGEMSELDEAKLVQRALQITYRQVQELEAWKAENLDKVAYHDEFVADEDLIQFRTLANQLGVGEQKLRDVLRAHGWIYRVDYQRWSNTKSKKVTEYQWRAMSDKKQYFRLVPNHNAPRLNG